MNFDRLNEIVAREANVSICPICGTPFDKYHSRQQTCGTEECKRLWKNKYLRERRKRLIAEDKAAFNFAHAEAQRKSRNKKKRLDQIARNYERMQKHWEKVAEFEKTVADHGLDYGKHQMAKTLAQVPKIDTTIGEKK